MRYLPLCVTATLLACLTVSVTGCKKADIAPSTQPVATQPVAAKPSADDGRGPKVTFCDIGGNAHHVVFVIDYSGSMAAASTGFGSVFDEVKMKMLASIKNLREVQDFHIILFTEAMPFEPPYKRLVPATNEYKASAAKFMETVSPRGGGGTDPIPSLERAFKVLADAESSRKGKIIFLLTDGAFRDNEAVKKCIRERNKNKDVHVYTYLFGEVDDASIIKLMKDIAKETGGEYKNVRE